MNKLLLTLALAWMITSCAPTVIPKATVVSTVAFDHNTQNAGVIDCDNHGCLVTSNWMTKYKAMETAFKSTDPDDVNIKAVGENYLVSYQVQNHYAEMRQAERGP